MKALTKLSKHFVSCYNLSSPNGREVPNQQVVVFSFGRLFRSYDSNIAFIPNDENIIYLGHDWDYSTTTGKYRNIFLGRTKQEVLEMIKDGRAKVIDL